MKRRSALIIGGGISGLAAARELGRNNITVTLLEAKRRFGGRIHTVQAGRVPIELGAEFLHGQSTTVINVLKEANVATEAVLDEHKIFANGRFERIDLWKTVGDVFHRINPRARDCSFEKFINAQTLGVPVKTLARNFVGGFDAADPGASASMRCCARNIRLNTWRIRNRRESPRDIPPWSIFLKKSWQRLAVSW